MKFVTWVPAACVALLAIIYAVLLPEAQQMRAYVRIGSTVFRVFPFLGQEISPEAAVIKMGIRYGIFSGLTPKTMEGVSAAATVHEEGGQHLDRQQQRALTQTFGKYNVYSSSSPPPQQQQSRSESDGTHPNKPTSGYTCEAVASVIEGVDVTWVTATTGGGGKNQNDTESPTLMYAHGGGFVEDGGSSSFSERLESHRLSVPCALAHFWKMRVLAVHFRQPPLHPITSSYQDFVKVFRAKFFLEQPKKVVFFGSGLGGNVAFSSLLRLRNRGVYMPAATVLVSPILDLTDAFPQEGNHDIELHASPSAQDLSFYANISLAAAERSTRTEKAGDLGRNEGDEEGDEEGDSGITMMQRQHHLSLISPYNHDFIALGPVAMLWEKSEFPGMATVYTWNELQKLGVRNTYAQRSGLFHQYAMYFDYIPEAYVDMAKARNFSLQFVR